MWSDSHITLCWFAMYNNRNVLKTVKYIFSIVVHNFVGIVEYFFIKCSVLFVVVCHGIWKVTDGTLS